MSYRNGFSTHGYPQKAHWVDGDDPPNGCVYALMLIFMVSLFLLGLFVGLVIA